MDKTKPSSIFDLDNTRRSINSGDLNRLCGGVSGPTWARYRGILGIKKHTLTARETYLLWIMATECKGVPGIDRPTLYRLASEALKRSPDQSQALPRLCGSEGVLGVDLSEAIGLATGIYPDESTIYRWVRDDRTLGTHSRRRRYDGRSIARLCNIAIASRAKFGKSKKLGINRGRSPTVGSPNKIGFKWLKAL